jgi:protein-S-isoprenylcysteine O-methyltransferase Ste14
MTQRLPEGAGPSRILLRIPVPWVFVLAYLVGAAMEWIYPARIGRAANVGIPIAGGVLFVIGAVIAGWGQLLFRRVRTTTVPGERSAALVTGGPYRATRNPMYVGLVLAYLGEAGMLNQLWPLVLLPLVVAYLDRRVIPLEEARLTDAFGARYEEYRARVRRWI